MSETMPVPPFVFYIVGYTLLLVAALVAVNVLLHRLTRREREGRRTAKRDGH